MTAAHHPPELDQVTVIVVTYQSAHCLAGLAPLLQACPHVIVSDNGSQDGCPQQAQALWPHATVLAHGRNLGFGAANNRALARVATPLALLLNPDCELTVANLVALVRVAQALPDAAVVAPQLTDAQGRPEVNYRWPHTLWASKGPGAEGPTCVGFVCGAAMLLRLARFEGVGYFDESFFLYYEDDDLCLRLFQAQRPLVLCPSVPAVHRSRGSVRGGSPWRSEYGRGYHHAQSKLHFTAKHVSLAAARAQRQRLLWQTALAIPLRVLLFSPKLVARMWGRWVGVMKWTPHD